MANAEPSSADAYIGSYISLITKSEIRYEGVLYHLSPQESTITLHNVKSYGTEGRKKGLNVLGSDKVYDYIFFRGSEIKDLHVISSPPPVQSTPALPNDPAIIQSHYPPSASIPSSISSLSPVPATNASSFSQYGLPNSSLQGIPAYNQSAGILGPWGSSPPHPTRNCKEIVRPACWPGHNGPSDGVSYSYSQEKSLLQTPRDPVPSSSMQQQQTQSSPSVTRTVPPPSTLPFSNPISATSIPPSAFSFLPILPITSNSKSTDKSSSLLKSTLTWESISSPVPSFVRSCGTVYSDTSTPSLSNAGHILQPSPISPSLSQVHVVQKDIEVVQESTPSKSECNTNPTEHVRFVPKKLNGAAISHRPNTKHQVQERGKRYTTVVNTPQKVGKYHRADEKLLNGVAFDNNHKCRGRGRGRENGANKVLNIHQGPQGDGDRARVRRPKINTAAAYVYPNDRGHGQWRKKQVPSKITKFAEEFDFEAMYEKFNKKEIWNHFGKRNESITEEKEKSEFHKFDSKSVYVEDEFFDKFSCNLPNNESLRGKLKISEQKKLNRETFGETYRYQHGSRGFAPGRGERSRVSDSGRGNRLMVWVRVS